MMYYSTTIWLKNQLTGKILRTIIIFGFLLKEVI